MYKNDLQLEMKQLDGELELEFVGAEVGSVQTALS